MPGVGGWIRGYRVGGGLPVLTRKWCCWPSYSSPWSARTSNRHSCSYLHRRATGPFAREFRAVCSAPSCLHNTHFPGRTQSAAAIPQRAWVERAQHASKDDSMTSVTDPRSGSYMQRSNGHNKSTLTSTAVAQGVRITSHTDVYLTHIQ